MLASIRKIVCHLTGAKRNALLRMQKEREREQPGHGGLRENYQ